MNKKLTKLMAALALLLMINLPGKMVGQTRDYVTMAYSGSTTTNMNEGNNAAIVGLNENEWSVTATKVNNNYPGLNSNGDIRLYSISSGEGSKITVTNSSGNTITSIEVTYVSNYSSGSVINNGTNNITGTTNGNTVTYDINNTSFYIQNTKTSTGSQVRFSSIKIYYSTSGGGGGSTPTITVSKNSLSGFTYSLGNGPSEVQTVKVSGSNLEDNISLALNDGNDSAFEISLSENSDYSNSLTLNQTSGTVAETTIYVRMKADLTVQDGGYSDAISLSSTNATSATVNLSGTVTPPSVTWDLTTAQFSSQSTDLVTWTSDYVTMTNAKNTSTQNANYYLGGVNNNANTRFYSNQIITISPIPHYAISKIEITATSSSYATAIKNNTWSNASATCSGSVVTLTPSNGDLDVSATFGSTVYVTKVQVYYTESTAIFYSIAIDDEILHGNVVANYNEAIAGKPITLSIYPDAGYYLEASNITVSGTTVTKVNAATCTFSMPANNVTVSAEFSVYNGIYYTLVTNTTDLIPGCHYIIASSKTNGAAYAMGGHSNTDYRDRVATAIAGTMIYETSGVSEIVLSGDDTNHWTLYDETTPGYLYAVSSNKLKTLNSMASLSASEWSISITENGNAEIVSYITTSNVSNTIRYNSGNSRFSCYNPTNTMEPVYLYMKANETTCKLYSATTIAKEVDCATCDLSNTNATLTIANGGILDCSGSITGATTSNLIIEDGGQLITSSAVAATVKKDITGYGDDNTVKTGWYFIASPLANAYTLTGTDMVSGNNNRVFDLYRLNNTTWENYQNSEHFSTFTALNNGTGYLYASSNDITLSFAGTIKPFTTTGDANEVALTNGWNLVGNPYTFNVYSSKSYYKITTSTEGGVSQNLITAVTSPSDFIAPCTGIVVKSTGTGSVAFTETAPAEWSTGNNGNIQMTLAQQATNRGNATILDNAIVSFNEGSQLEKFYFMEQNANLYIPQGTEEYAIAYSNGQGEMPVNFRANENGQYTLTVNPENVEMGYLHLIDNMTGANIDLLATPSYSFEAKTTDFESRFRLVFSANSNETESDSFAFFSNGQLIINNNGQATLQVIDLTGRLLSSETINGTCSTTLNAPAGVYMIRLVNGENVKVQKIVVR